MTEMVELSDKSFKAAIIRMFKLAITYLLGEKIESLIKETGGIKQNQMKFLNFKLKKLKFKFLNFKLKS